MTNVRHLEGLHCPVCKQESELLIAGAGLFAITDDAIGEACSGVTFDSEALTACPRCDYRGPRSDFRKDNPDPPEEKPYAVRILTTKRFSKVYRAATGDHAVRTARKDMDEKGIGIEAECKEDAEYYEYLVDSDFELLTEAEAVALEKAAQGEEE